MPASMPPGRRRPGSGRRGSPWIDGSTRVTVSERLLATQTRPPPTVIPAGPRPARIGGAGRRGAEVDAADRAGRGAADPEAAGADGEPQRRRVGGDAAPDRPGRPAALIAVTPAPSSSATQTRPPPETIAPGRPPTSIRRDHAGRRRVDPEDLAGAGARDPDRACADGDAGDAACRAAAACRRPSRVWGRSGSGCRRRRSSPRRRLRPTASRSGGVADRDRRGDRDVVAAEQEDEGGDQRDERPRASPASPSARDRTRAAQASRLAPPGSARVGASGPLGRGPGSRPGSPPGARAPPRSARRRSGSARPGPWRPRARSPSSMPARHLRLGVGVLAREGDDPGQRLVEDAAERVDVGGRADALAAPLLGRHVLDRADDRGAAASAGLGEALARPKSER